jgi:hypothetical protein
MRMAVNPADRSVLQELAQLCGKTKYEKGLETKLTYQPICGVWVVGLRTREMGGVDRIAHPHLLKKHLRIQHNHTRPPVTTLEVGRISAANFG